MKLGKTGSFILYEVLIWNAAKLGFVFAYRFSNNELSINEKRK